VHVHQDFCLYLAGKTITMSEARQDTRREKERERERERKAKRY
jgi:hypothetical protein